jgi:hypothetical protein
LHGQCELASVLGEQCGDRPIPADSEADGKKQFPNAAALLGAGVPKNVPREFRLRNNPVAILDEAREHAHFIGLEPMHHVQRDARSFPNGLILAIDLVHRRQR